MPRSPLNQSTSITSEVTRDFVGKLFSSDGVTPKYDGIPTTGNFLECSSLDASGLPATAFYGTDSGANQVTIAIGGLFGLSSAFQTTAVLDGTTIHNLWHYDEGEAFSATISLMFADESNAPSFILKFTKAKGAEPLLEAFENHNGALVSMGPAEQIGCDLRGN